MKAGPLIPQGRNGEGTDRSQTVRGRAHFSSPIMPKMATWSPNAFSISRVRRQATRAVPRDWAFGLRIELPPVHQRAAQMHHCGCKQSHRVERMSGLVRELGHGR
jgi:hypothetical protein